MQALILISMLFLLLGELVGTGLLLQTSIGCRIFLGTLFFSQYNLQTPKTIIKVPVSTRAVPSSIPVCREMQSSYSRHSNGLASTLKGGSLTEKAFTVVAALLIMRTPEGAVHFITFSQCKLNLCENNQSD